MNLLKKLLKKHKKATSKEVPKETPKVVKDEFYYSNLTSTYQWKTKYNYYCKTKELVENWVLYESHAGAGMLCNPLALFKEFLKRDDFSNYLHIWVIADDSEIEYLRNEYKEYPNVLFVKYHTVGYAYFVARCKRLINNTSFLGFFSKREGQLLLNTWHSITVKYLGYDIVDGKRHVSNMLRNLLMADYIISPNEFMTGIFDDSFRLRNIYKGKYIEEGYPRNDNVLHTKRDEIIKKLSAHGTQVDPNKKIILYAPTWSGNNVSTPKIDFERYSAITEKFKNSIDNQKYQLLIKPHQIEYRNLTKEQLELGNFVSYSIDANELLSIVDIVITDYSSIYFDYLVAKKPVLFYIPDLEEYSKTRGIYFTVDELPGPCAKNFDELANYINDIEQVKEKYNESLNDTRGWACKYDDGNVSKRVLDIFFNGNENYNIKSAKNTGKKSLLLYPGTLATNGVTSAFLSLLNNIDYDKYDVSVFVLASKAEAPNINLDKIPHQVRTILRVTAPMLSAKEKAIYDLGVKQGYLLEGKKFESFKRIMEREYVRVLGKAHFDYIIDYSGYGTYFPMLATLGCKDANTQKYIWQHSDILAEYSNTEKREINHNNADINALLACYSKFDKIVSSTESVCAINKENLATDETRDKFDYATNLLDIERFERLAADTSCYMNGNDLYIENESKPSGFKNLTIIPIKENHIKFVSMGRLMPEKNHKNIIAAIKRLNDEGINAVLYIIGDGLLREQLESLALDLGIADKIIITGMIQNPLAILKQCDCFVFPSLYEAQGLAVLEARIVGMPIILSNFKAVKSVLIDDKQYITKGFEADDIYEGMKAFIDGKIPTDYTFDIEAYNKNGMTEFEGLLN